MTTLTWTGGATANVNSEKTATITLKDNDVRAVYIDWDDGESNKKTESNYQWVGTGIDTLTVSDIDATGIMRVENRTIKSGIDNSVFEATGPTKIYAQVPPTLSSAELTYAGSIKLEVKCVVAKSSLSATLADGKMETGYSKSIETISTQLTSLSTQTGLFPLTPVGSSIERVLSIKYLNPKLTGTDTTDYTKNAALNKLKIFIIAITQPPAGAGVPVAIGYVSVGSPYKETNDIDRCITLDFSQSRPAAANASNSFYFYDNGKGWFGVNYNRWALATSRWEIV